MTNDWQHRLFALVDDLDDDLIALRRRLHQYPEPSDAEFKTSRHLYEVLTEHNLNARLGHDGRGVLVESRQQDSSKRIALRADIDALLLGDDKQVDYHSTVPNVMHACGHDAHASALFGALVALDQLVTEGVLPCSLTWRGIFQPSEETVTGAGEMIAGGALADVDAIIALHVDPTRPVGVIGVRAGTFTANCDAMRIEIDGLASHAARPHEAKDPIAAAAQLISALYQLVPRGIDSQDAVVVTITQIHGGTTGNVIPERVELTGMIRTLDRDVRTRTMSHVAHLTQSVAEMTGTQMHVEFGSSIPGVENDPRLTRLVESAAGDLLGSDRVQEISRPSMGGEDFANYLEHVPGTMFRLGCARDTGPSTGLHTPLFDIDERCLAIGAKLLASAAVLAAVDTL
ncbi:MAG: M20 metallopeptidase family protein [Aeoliella sp.]